MITVVVGKRRNTTPWFSVSVKEQNEPRPQTARTATVNRTNRDRKPYEPRPHEPRPQTAQTATANRTNRDRTAVLTYF